MRNECRACALWTMDFGHEESFLSGFRACEDAVRTRKTNWGGDALA